MDVMAAKAEFRLLRELVGISQTQLAKELQVDARSVRRWESPDNGWAPAQFACDWLENARAEQMDVVAAALDAVDGLPAGAPVKLTYWLSADDYEQAHPGQGSRWEMANANSRLVYDNLQAQGRDVRAGFEGLRAVVEPDELPDGY